MNRHGANGDRVTELRELLRPLAESAGVMAVQVATRDGLPLEMIGHGLRADVLAAEAASLLASAGSAADRLLLGESDHVMVALPDYRLVCFPLERHLLALVVSEADAEPAVALAKGALAEVQAAMTASA